MVKSRYYPQLPPEIPSVIKEEVRFVRDALYDLRDGNPYDIKTYTLTKNTAISFPFVVGKLAMVILIQDGVGGRTLQWDSKIKGTNTLTLSTTANTYSVVFLYPVSDSRVLVVVLLAELCDSPVNISVPIDILLDSDIIS